jgi:TonB family protein
MGQSTREKGRTQQYAGDDSLTQNDPLPQAYFKRNIPTEAPAFVKIELRRASLGPGVIVGSRNSDSNYGDSSDGKGKNFGPAGPFVLEEQIVTGEDGKQRIVGGVLNGKAIEKPAPVYPVIAKAARAQGPVVIAVTVDETGRVISAAAEAGHPLLKEAARLAALQARFSPTTLSGQPVKVTGKITYNFILTESGGAPPDPQAAKP